MALSSTAVPYYQSGSPMTDEYLASYTFLNGTIYPYPGMVGMYAEFDVGTPAARNICGWQLVVAAATIIPALGTVLYWSDKSVFKVTTDPTAGPLAGISPKLMAAAASAFWMIKKGDRSVLFVNAPTVAVALGLPVVGAQGTAGKADTLANAETQAAFPLIGVALGAAVSNVANVRINIPDWS